MEKIIGVFLKTLFRDEKTGMSTFCFCPDEYNENAENGLLKCSGKIGLYQHNAPIFIEGEFQNGEFHVNKSGYPKDNKKACIQLLDYISKEFTEKEKEKIADLCKNDLLGFMELPKAEMELKRVLSRKKNASKLIHLIYAKAKEIKKEEELYDFLLKNNVGYDRIYALQKNGISLNELKKSTYFLCLFNGIDIYTADLLACKLKDMEKYDIERLIGFVYGSVLLNKTSGNSCIELNKLCKIVNYRFKNSIYPDTEINVSILLYCLSLMKKYISIFELNEQVYIYEKKILEEENECIRNIERLNNEKITIMKNVDCESVEKKIGFQLKPAQKNAVGLIRTNGVKVLTGPPGAGKTATIKAIIAKYKEEHPNNKIALSATTGAASQVMSEATGMPAKTTNKMLDIRPFDGDVLTKNINDPIDADLIIVDEISMIGLFLFSRLLASVKSGSILILVGDKDQLQSVEYGNVLADLIESKSIEVCHLTEVIRSNELIYNNAIKINKGDLRLEENKAFMIYNFTTAEDAVTYFEQNLQNDKALILSPVKRGVMGVQNLNRIVQKHFGSNDSLLRYGSTDYYRYDKIIMTQTNYQAGYFNGNIGVIIDKKNDNLLVRFKNKTLFLEPSDFQYMALAHAITSHKSQGTEADIVRIFLPDTPVGMLTRRIFYTSVTRAKKEVYIYTVKDSYKQAISNIREQKRDSLLAQRIAKKMYET